MFLLPSIRAKIGVYAGLLLALSMTAGIGYAVKMARDSALENAVQVVRDSAVIEASRIQRHFELGMDAARNTAATFEVLRSSSREPSREDVVGILKQLVLGNSDFFGSWCVWEPDAFDGKDAAYANAPGHTRTGRFVPYWNKVGGLHLEGTGDTLEQPGEDTWYTQPRDSGAETVLEPAVYEVNGKDTMMVSLAVPIRDGNKGSVGVVGADLSAEFLQSIADGMDEFDGKATMTLFCHTGKVAAVTGRRDVAGKPLSGIAANSKEMLQAVQQKREYKDFSDGALHMVVPLMFGNSPQVWGIAISVPESIIYAHAREMAWSLSFIGLFGLVVALGGACFSGNRYFPPHPRYGRRHRQHFRRQSGCAARSQGTRRGGRHAERRQRHGRQIEGQYRRDRGPEQTGPGKDPPGGTGHAGRGGIQETGGTGPQPGHAPGRAEAGIHRGANVRCVRGDFASGRRGSGRVGTPEGPHNPGRHGHGGD